MTTTELLRLIARRGYRITRPRRRTIEALAAAEAPLNVRAIHEAVGPDTADLATVYRTLRWLVKLGLARTMTVGPGGERFELVSPGLHTHHLRCDRCGAVRTVAVCGLDRGIAARIARVYGFDVERHELTFHGRCAACADGKREGEPEPRVAR